MISETLNTTGTSLQKMPTTSEQIDVGRKRSSEQPDKAPETTKPSALPTEELLSKIKALTEDGMYSVRFETDYKTQQLVVKIVDNQTQEIVRQIPPEQALGLKQALTDYEGNFVNTKS
jgi:flagellar protein FlaG